MRASSETRQLVSLCQKDKDKPPFWCASSESHRHVSMCQKGKDMLPFLRASLESCLCVSFGRKDKDKPPFLHAPSVFRRLVSLWVIQQADVAVSPRIVGDNVARPVVAHPIDDNDLQRTRVICVGQQRVETAGNAPLFIPARDNDSD